MEKPLKYKRTKADWLGHARAFEARAVDADKRGDWALVEGRGELEAHLRSAADSYRRAALVIHDTIASELETPNV